MLAKILTILNKVIPKKNIIVFNSYPAYSDNSMALYKYIIHNRKDLCEKYSLYWSQESDDLNKFEEKHIKLNVIRKKSLKGIWIFLCAKYIVSTHGYFLDVHSGAGQVQVNLWHGCGYKSVPENERFYRGDINIVVGEIYRKIHSDIFNIPIENVYVTGYPRNDAFFEDVDLMDKIGIDKNKYSKLFIWMPTYRKAIEGHNAVDGDENSFGISSIGYEEFKNLDNVLRKNNYFMIIKPHPMDALAIKRIDNVTNMCCITNEDLKKKDLELYSLLKESDVLLSDYSSVVIDYLLLNKPIVYVLSDMNEYKNNRGFVLNPIEDYMPGPIVSNFNELIGYFENVESENKKYDKKREKISFDVHKYMDCNSSKRVCDLLWGKETEK